MNIVLFTLLSCLTLFFFIFLGIGKFGLLPSYSHYAKKWNETYPIQNLNLWSLITFLAAMFILPVLLEIGNGNMLQFLGFFVPVYLICVSLTPGWEENKKIHKWHSIFAISCAICAILFIILVLGKWWCCLIGIIIVAISALLTKTFKYATTFWLEMIMFISIYLGLII